MKIALKIILLVWIVVRVKSSFAQDYNYIHYTAKDGLASNTVYDVAQDDDGFLYFATDNGLSRFDGKEWKTFTVKDGLPDNEVLLIFKDSKNRLWLSTFGKSLSCFLNGKIIQPPNLDAITSNGEIIISFAETKDGYIYIQTVHSIFCISPNLVIEKVYKGGFSFLQTITMGIINDHLSFIDNDSLYVLNTSNVIQKNKVANPKTFFQEKFIDKYNSSFTPSQILSYGLGPNKITFVNTLQGVYFIDTVSKLPTLCFLKERKVGHSIIDIEKNFWFTTLDKGVYKLPSFTFNSLIENKESGISNTEVFSIQKLKKEILVGYSFGKLLTLHNNSATVSRWIDFQQYIKDPSNTAKSNKIKSIVCIDSNSVLLGLDGFFVLKSKKKTIINYFLHPCKSIEIANMNNAVISTGAGVFKIDINELCIKDIIYSKRSTYSTYFNNNYYVGTLEGLYKITPQKQQTYLGNNHPSLKRRITCLKTTKDYLIVATADSGIAILQNDKVIKIITENNGLGSNICKTLFVHNNTLYIGTVKGIAVYDMSKWKVTTQFTSSDGLPSNIINAIYVDNDSTIYIGTPEGLTKFKEHDISQQSICNLVVENVVVSNQSLKSDSNNFSIKYNDNVVFNFLAISFRSANKITYYYKLSELNTNYLSTTQRSINYQSLQAGTYTFELYAVNKFGVRSKTYTCTFTVTPPFYKTWWFYLLELGLLTAIIWAIVYTRYRRKQKIYKQVSDFKVQLANMEQQALQSQMNPHFIFNSLNSIQQFVLKNDELSTNKYLASFSRLMRKTLDNSAQKTITLDNEIEYLNEYLQLELLRFNNSFTYKIVADNNIDIDFIQIPSMLLQPFIENAIRHGIRHKQAGVGHIEIQFKQIENILICSVIDNGIGRAASAELKLLEPLKHNSKAMNITAKRIELLNTELQEPIELEIIDLKDSNGNALGTQVNIKIPLRNYATN